MTEAEWRACGDPAAMLESLRGRAGDRKLRLFAVACCRRAGPTLSSEGRAVAAAVENCADGLADLEDVRRRLPAEFPGPLEEDWAWGDERRRLREPAPDWLTDDELARFEAAGVWFPELLFLPDAVWSARVTARAMRGLREVQIASEVIRLRAPSGPRGLAGWRARWSEVIRLRATSGRRRLAGWRVRWDELEAQIDAATADEAAWQPAALRDLFGDLVRPALRVDPAWLAWNGRTAPRLAEAVYDERAFDRLPILGDALEDAGCADPELLAHCRGPGPHVRGCWVIDLLLGKE
jgi:hypothetical protein